MPLLYKSDSPFVAGASSIKDSTVWTRTGASLFDVGHMCSLRWTGKDAADFLERVTVADVHGLGMNQSTLSVITNETGGVIDDTMITKCPDHIYQVIDPVALFLSSRLDRFPSTARCLCTVTPTASDLIKSGC
jgi:glycine cleavage system aminomethyltransferase T